MGPFLTTVPHLENRDSRTRGTGAGVHIDQDCMTADGFIVWDKVRYRDRFVPAYDKPSRGVWRYDGGDEEFRPGEPWRDAYRSTD